VINPREKYDANIPDVFAPPLAGLGLSRILLLLLFLFLFLLVSFFLFHFLFLFRFRQLKKKQIILRKDGTRYR
jgi:hypothetical protein